MTSPSLPNDIPTVHLPPTSATPFDDNTGHLYLDNSDQESRSLVPVNSDKEFENLQRDCALFPAYTDYIYGPDTRPNPRHDVLLGIPSTPSIPADFIRKRNWSSWIPPEENAWIYLNKRSMVQKAMADRAIAEQASMPWPSRNFPQLHGLVCPTSTSLPKLNQTDPVTILPAIPNSSSIVPSATTFALMPGDITNTEFQGFSDTQRQKINAIVTNCWTCLRDPHAGHASAKATLVQITRQVQAQHCNWVLRDGVRKLWRCLKIQHSTYVSLGHELHIPWLNGKYGTLLYVP